MLNIMKKQMKFIFKYFLFSSEFRRREISIIQIRFQYSSQRINF